jgi:hypothetical protein
MQANLVNFWGIFQRRTTNDAPLTGAPAAPRQKTYSAQSGYVYQYFYKGHRAAPQGLEYVFDVSADRKTSVAVSVLVTHEAVAQWETGHGRTLSSTERYAIAKMSLFQAFDERSEPALMRQPVLARAADVDSILEGLDID